MKKFLTQTHNHETYVIEFKGVEYELQVDATEQRHIIEVFNLSLNDDVSDEALTFFEDQVGRIDH